MALIYIVEDDRSILEIEEFALKNSGYHVEGFKEAKSFYTALKNQLPDLVLLDIMLPDEDGLTIMGKIRANEETSKLPVIMLTAKTTEIDKVKGLDMGADDYMTKPFGVMELISRVKALLRRTLPQEAEVSFSFGRIEMDERKHQVLVCGNPCELTYKEYELLKIFLSNTGIVVTRERILDKIWGTDFIGESRTIDMHVKNLRKKLGEEGGLIKTVRNVGYVMNAE